MRIFIISGLIFCGVASAEPYLMGQDEYLAIKKTAEAIKGKEKGQENAVVIGLGQSPTPWITFLKELDPKSAYSIPISDMKWGQTYGTLPEETVKALYAHFDKVVPSKEALGDRPLIISDYANTGFTFQNTMLYLQDYLKERGYKNSISYVAVVSSLRPNTLKTRLDLLLAPFRTVEGAEPMMEKVEAAQYDLYSELGSASPVYGFKKHPWEGRRHNDFRRAMRGRIANDGLPLLAAEPPPELAVGGGGGKCNFLPMIAPH